MKNYDFQEKYFQIFGPIESYFECITSCDISDGRCISRCVEILKRNKKLNFLVILKISNISWHYF